MCTDSRILIPALSPRARVMPPWRPEVSTASSSMSDGADRVLAEFQQHSAGGRGMHKDVEMSAGADLDLVGDEAHAACLKIFEGGGNIVHMNGYVVQAFA